MQSKGGYKGWSMPSQAVTAPVQRKEPAGLLNDPTFLEACKAVGVKPTGRQASKFRNGYGAAYRAVTP